MDDEIERRKAATDDGALVAYEQAWARKLTRLQRAHPARWRIPGLSEEEVRDELLLRLVEAIRAVPSLTGSTLDFLARERRSLRRSFRLDIVLTDIPAATAERSPSQEERLLDDEASSLQAAARANAESALTRPQRQWFAALRQSANAGAFFAESGRVNLAAAARVLDRDRSSAQRAFTELSAHFGRELRKLVRE